VPRRTRIEEWHLARTVAVLTVLINLVLLKTAKILQLPSCGEHVTFLAYLQIIPFNYGAENYIDLRFLLPLLLRVEMVTHLNTNLLQ
jgi:hypothetical protein